MIPKGRWSESILEVLWAIGLYYNERVFKGRVASTDGVIQQVEGFVS